MAPSALHVNIKRLLVQQKRQGQAEEGGQGEGE